MTAVDLQDVRVTAGTRVLLDVKRLTVARGERIAIVGPNGAGKTTLLKLIAGLVSPDAGQVQVLGRCTHRAGDASTSRIGVRDRRNLRREIGIVLQGLHLVHRLTARENVMIGALGRLRGIDSVRSLVRWYPSSLMDEADAALVAFGMGDRAGTRADQLSGGERQKVALARVQMQDPLLVLADEPTSALDPAATRQVCSALAAAVNGPKKSLLTVVHDLELLPYLATRVIGMTDGQILWDRQIGDVTSMQLEALYGRRAGSVQIASMDCSPMVASLVGT